VELSGGGNRKASGFGNSNEITKMPQLHITHAWKIWLPSYKVFVQATRSRDRRRHMITISQWFFDELYHTTQAYLAGGAK
jgi:hypothetical protein